LYFIYNLYLYINIPNILPIIAISPIIVFGNTLNDIFNSLIIVSLITKLYYYFPFYLFCYKVSIASLFTILTVFVFAILLGSINLNVTSSLLFIFIALVVISS
jgi:hypothetical protein